LHLAIVLDLDTIITRNKLTLQAHNLKNKPPNIAGIIIKAGKFVRKVTLRSNLKESDVIYFEYKE
jgi:hypothetical protein